MSSLVRSICRVLPAVSASVLPLLSLSVPAEAVLPPVGSDRSRLVMLPEEAQMSALP
ncbi:MAG: endolysin, partial [Synechococcus sp. TMED90]